jgi:uncharacterized membrane protein
MKSRKLMFAAMTLFAVLATPVRMPAKEHTRYRLAGLGTLGGPNSFIPMPVGIELTNTSTVVGESDTSIPDPYFRNCFQATCLVNHTFVSQKDVLADLGALPGVNSSIPFATNTRAQTVGGSENGVIDPLTGFPEFRAVLWQNGQVLDLGTLGGNNALAANINNRGQVVGGAQNTAPDSFGFCFQPFTAFFPTQVHAFRWEDGVMLDLGTLGGNDSCAYLLNEHGQIGGFSYTNSIPNPTTGIPTLHPFLWENGKLSDLGTLRVLPLRRISSITEVRLSVYRTWPVI